MSSFKLIEERLRRVGQAHLLSHYQSLNDTEQALLLKNTDLDYDTIVQAFKTSTKTDSIKAVPSPLPSDSRAKVDQDQKKWYDLGMKAIAENKVAVILLAGGQGTRLGSSDPKGCYDILLPSHKSLFQLQAERIVKLQELSGGIIPFYIMTSGPTRYATEQFFIKHNFFGLLVENVVFFEQGVLPAFDLDGKILMESKTSPAFSPDGNGGIYAALRKEGILKNMRSRGRTLIQTYCVDNSLVKVADPVFIGYCIETQSDCAVKSISKTRADEQVGVICLKDGVPAVMEYSEIDPLTSSSINANDGTLMYGCANIANHFFTLAFLESVEGFESKLQYHVAKKAIKHVNERGEYIEPSHKNGIKLELFIFDVFAFAKNFKVLECRRSDEFSPLKNGPGSKDGDSPDTSRADIMRLHQLWVRNAGGVVDDGDIEISPLVSYGGEGLDWLREVDIVTPVHIKSKSQFKQFD